MSSSKTTQLKLYRSLIKSKLNYGSELLHSAPLTQLKRLDSIQYRCLKIICKAAHSTPLLALQNETGELPLHLDRQRYLAKYFTRNKNSVNNPVHSTLKDSWQIHYGKFKSPPFIKQLEQFIPLINKFNDFNYLSAKPFWLYQPLDIDTFLSVKKINF